MKRSFYSLLSIYFIISNHKKHIQYQLSAFYLIYYTRPLTYINLTKQWCYVNLYRLSDTFSYLCIVITINNKPFLLT